MSNKTAVSIQGGKINRKGAEALADSIVRVLQVGYESRAEQVTIQKALDILRSAAGTSGVTVCDSSFKM